MLDGDDQRVIFMMINVWGIFFRENNIDPSCSDDTLRKNGECDVYNKQLPCVSLLSGHGEAPLRDTSDYGDWFMV